MIFRTVRRPTPTPSRLRRDTSPPNDGGEETRRARGLHSEEEAVTRAFPLPPEGGEVAPRSGDGVGEGGGETRSRRRTGTTARARGLRQNDNQAEALLWLELKRRKLGGYKFTRQFPIGPYFADFACRERWLVVEIDGHQHAGSDHDRRRDGFINAEGFSILRFWNHAVIKARGEVCETTLAALIGRLASKVDAVDLQIKPSASSDPRTLDQRVQA